MLYIRDRSYNDVLPVSTAITMWPSSCVAVCWMGGAIETIYFATVDVELPGKCRMATAGRSSEYELSVAHLVIQIRVCYGRRRDIDSYNGSSAEVGDGQV